MKEFIITCIIIFSICFAQSTETDSLYTTHKTIGFDKIQHAAFSCLLTLSSQYVMINKSGFDETKALSYSVSSVAFIGLTKELHDKQTRKTPFDWGDLIANIVGIGIAVLIITQ